MLRRSHRAVFGCARPVIVVLLGLGLALPGSALAAKLAGGGRQASIARAFSASPARRGQVIVSIRLSSVASNWAVVKSVRPGRGRGGRLTLLSTYMHPAAGGERAGSPPAAVRADLGRHFRVAVVYTGSGSETVAYQQFYRSVCAGAGGFVDQESVSVNPMSWRVRYVVDLDNVLAAVHSAQGAAFVPSIALDGRASQLSAVESITRQSDDAGCNSPPTTYRCTVRFHLSSAQLGGALSLLPDDGTEIGVPFSISAGTPCDRDRLPLGAPLWESGGTTALIGRLGLGGGILPGNPYAPISVSWPSSSALFQQGFIASPCQGDAVACTDSFQWRGKVALQPVSG